MAEESDTGENEVPVTQASSGVMAIEAWAEAKKTPDWHLAATKAAKKWGMGKEVSESEFDAAVAFTLALKINAS